MSRIMTVRRSFLINLLVMVCAAGLLQACGSKKKAPPPTPTKAFGTAALIETDNLGDALDSEIAIDANGNALAVWFQFDGTRNNVWSNRYTAGAGWGTAALIETDNAGNAFNPQIAFDANGNALAVWYQDGDVTAAVRNDIWSNRYTAGAGWGMAALIETGDATFPQIAFDINGNALAVWRQSDGTRYNISSKRYTATTGLWGAATLIETDNAGDATSPQIAIDTNGNALAVWHQDGDATATVRNDIWSNRYTATTGLWGTAALIETDDAGSAGRPQIAINANGNALAVWVQFDGTRENIWSNRYTAGAGWGTAALIETDNVGGANSPQIAIDANGNALAVWNQHDGTRDNIWANRYQ